MAFVSGQVLLHGFHVVQPNEHALPGPLLLLLVYTRVDPSVVYHKSVPPSHC